MEKMWQLLPEVSQNFIKKYPEYSPVICQLLFSRGIIEPVEMENFFNAKDEKNFFDPFLFNDMSLAVDSIISHIKSGHKIIAYGDYDADGVTSSAIIVEVLNLLKAKVNIYIPERVREGYGLNNKAIDIIATQEIKLIITVDCGIRNFKEVEYARSLGIEVIISDHHVPPENKDELPKCLILDSALKNELYPFKNLSGAGVSFKLAKAVLSRSKLTTEQKKEVEKRVYDILAIGTVADCVRLLGENRSLVKLGLEILNKTKRPGLVALINSAKIGSDKKIDSWNISFQIAPRLNAAGRMNHANTAYQLLITKNKNEAEELAKKLNESNINRQKNTEDILARVEEQIHPNTHDKIIIGVCSIDENKEEAVWNEGVIGLVAGKICEKYYRPTLIITKTNEGYKGSGRSIPEFNIIDAVEQCRQYLDKFGGHPAACGFSFKRGNLENFKNAIKKIAKEKLSGLNLTPKLSIDCQLDLSDIDHNIVAEIEKLEPFGQNNERPKFASFNIKVLDIINMGSDGQHLKLRLRSEKSSVYSAIGFGQTEKWNKLKIDDIIDLVYYIELNEFRGRSEIQLKIIDIKTPKI
jgi:single-stranded-DNA-specific exonuclease